LLRRNDAQIGAGIGIGGMALQDRLPCGLGLCELTLLLERDGCFALLWPGGRSLGGAVQTRDYKDRSQSHSG
jgi:hypothetical protein